MLKKEIREELVLADSRQLGNPGTPAFRIDKYPFYLLNRAVSRYNIIVEARLRKIGIDIPTWRVLMVLGEKSPRSVGQITDAAVINLSTMMRITQRMEKAGLVLTCCGHEDGRVTEVSLTAFGRQKLGESREIAAPIYAAVIEGFSARDFDKLIALLNLLYGNLGQLSNA
jgi:DNA-binding MarR family transcriptional regulator